MFWWTSTIFLFVIFKFTFCSRDALMDENGDFLPHIRLAKDLMDPRRYDNRVRPVMNHSKPTNVKFSMSLYQILSINEKQQNIDLNVWAIQEWTDDFLGWNPYLYGMINTTILPYTAIWLPDTYLYNSVVMNREETERYINVVITTNYWKGKSGAEVKLMYPALYRTSCLLDIRFFPYDQQSCKLTISSWTSSAADITYEPAHATVNMDNFIPNEEWVVVNFKVNRTVQTFKCCPEPWILLDAILIVRRKPLYYIVNLVIPTSVITLVAVTGFFTAASTSSERREKLSLGIDSLLAMSILMMMVSEQMPTSSDFVPLFGIFYLSIIFIIFLGTIFTAFILNVHLQKMYTKPVSPIIAFLFFGKIAQWLRMRPPTMLLELWNETGVTFGRKPVKKPRKMDKQKLMKVTSTSSGLSLIKGGETRSSMKAPLAPPISARSYVSMDDEVKRERARKNWHRIVNKVQENKGQIENNGGVVVNGKTSYGERGQLRQVNQRRKPPAIPLPQNEPGPLMLSASAISAFSTTGDSTILESKLKRRYALEWEYLASVLDRVLLIVFSIAVFLVTSIMMMDAQFLGSLIYNIPADYFA
ncbi:unnamed protein product [Caenorhabditis angaria]|uniref:Neurotransmitter-gated ion-channel ligand-binding domain-containing protein n=1 Tax=Caenorhabditis angaria TaxID=860376 RepID=A0A9P1N5J6_9PELO|nr:unnamed protein product [Caenorhabditis angaria]